MYHCTKTYYKRQTEPIKAKETRSVKYVTTTLVFGKLKL